MKFHVLTRRGGPGMEIEAPSMRHLIAGLDQRPTAVSVLCASQQHLHWPDSQWESVDDLMNELWEEVKGDHTANQDQAG